MNTVMTTTLLSNYKIWGTLLISQLSPFFLFFFSFCLPTSQCYNLQKESFDAPSKTAAKN